MMNKHEVAAILEEIGVLLDLQGANPFRVRAYHNAARTIENLDDLEDFAKNHPLDSLPGIGKDLAEKITLLLQTGTLPYYEELKKSLPEGLMELLQVGGLGAKKVKMLFDKLGISNIDQLSKALEKGKISELPGFGKKSQENLKTSVSSLKTYGKRLLWWKAMKIATPLLKKMQKFEHVIQADLAGSARRKLETVGDLDFVISSKKPGKVMDWLASHPLVERVISKGKTKTTLLLKEGLQADVRVVPQDQYAFALLYFTGSKNHSIKLRKRANSRGLTLNEYGLETLKKPTRKKHLLSEEEIYHALGMDYIPPELREDRGEIEAAEEWKLPSLIQEKDLRGVFHCHTTSSDGHNTLEEMVKAAEKLGWEYIGIADHSKTSVQAGGMSEEQLLEQIQTIRAFNKKKKSSCYAFAGLECDILEDGTLDFPGSVLKELDYVVVSIHRRYKQNEKQATRRLIKAIENPHTTIIGHLTGRLLLKREPIALDINQVIDAAIANGKVMEINAHPNRLDMDWRFWHKAKEKGLKCAINPDAHQTSDLLYFKAGIHCAQKGWLEKTDVINTLNIKDLKKFLQKRS